MLNNVTALIVTFLRDIALHNCVDTLRATYPDIKIIVGDQAPTAAKRVMYGVDTYIELPRDCGVSYARNRLLEACKTDYILIADDDFTFSPASQLDKLLTCMSFADIAGGALLQDGVIRHYEATLQSIPEDGAAKWKALDLPSDFRFLPGLRYAPAECIFNFFMAKTAAIRKMGGWDEQFKIGYEHSDFFLRTRAHNLKVVYCPDAMVVHRDKAIQADPPEYKAHRFRPDSVPLFFKKWGLTYLEDTAGGRLYATGERTLAGRPHPPLYQGSTFANPFRRHAAKRGLLLAQRILDTLGIPFWLSNGTLLGAVRNGDLIPHDTDLDIGVFNGTDSDALYAALVAKGFGYIRHYGNRGNGFELAFLVPGPHRVKLDIFFYQQLEGGRMWMGLHTRAGMRKMIFPALGGGGSETLMGHVFPAPYHSHDWLAANYGPEWIKPDPHWQWNTSPRNFDDKRCG